MSKWKALMKSIFQLPIWTRHADDAMLPCLLNLRNAKNIDFHTQAYCSDAK